MSGTPPAPLPVAASLPALRDALEHPGVAVLQAPPGAGKTTIVPLELLDQPWLAGRRIVMLEPRRLAARAAARRMAFLLREPVGETVGYRVRFDSRVSPRTRIEVVTEGVLTRIRQDDPALEGIGLLLFDEFHERSIHADLGLALALETRSVLRPDLRLLVMSATLDGERVARLLDDSPVITSRGREYAVEIRYRPRTQGQRLDAAVAGVIREALEAHRGDILGFLPGVAEIRRTGERLEQSALPRGIRLHQLHGMRSLEEQDAAIVPAPAGSRKVVLATSIAETSLTIEGVAVVIDAGLMRVPRFSPRTGMSRLETVRVTRASAEQRRGRAGRTAPGVCYRMWSAADEAGLVPFNTPEILATDLAALALHLAAAGVRRPDQLRWLDPPPESSWNQAIELLGLLGAIDREGRITPRGRAMADLPIHPRLGHMMIEARRLQLGSLAAELAALLSDRDIARSDSGAEADADIRLRLDALRRGRGVPGLTVDHGALRRAQAEAAEWRRRLHARGTAAESEAGRLLALAYPDRIARSRGGPGRFLLRNGRGARLGSGQSLARSEWIVAADLDDAGSESVIRTAAPLAPEVVEELARDAESADEVIWDEGTASVRPRRIRRLGAIVIDERSLPRPDPEQVRAVLLRAIASAGIERLPWSDEALLLRQRLAFLHRVDPDWRDVSDQALLAVLDQWLGPEIEGMNRLEQLTPVRLKQALSRLVPPDRRAALDRLAPERIEVPSGSRIAIDYSDPERPVLAVRLQEVFGLRATPRIAGGRVSLTLHLLSPAYRPVQVTRDLESFWQTGYFEVRKDLRGRYPKHPWPDDPLTAPAGRRGRR